MKVDRLISIINILNNKKRVTASELAEKFEVSSKTIQRDIDAIDASGIPIISYKGKNGGYEIMEGYKIDKSVLTGDQGLLLINLLKGFYQQYGSEDLKYLINKFESKENVISEERLVIDFSPWGESKFLQENIKKFDNAIINNKVVQFEYVDLKGNISEREIEPYQMILKGFNWYLYGFCRLRNEMRIFKIKRMKNISIKDEYFPRNKEISKEIFGEWEGKMLTFQLKFYRNSIYLIDEYFCKYDVIESCEEYKIIETILPEDNYLYSMILGLADNAVVLKPESFRQNIKKKIEKMNLNYK